jgi:hypothetical protein
MLKCCWLHTLSCIFMFCSFANIGHADMKSNVLSTCCHSLYLLSVSASNIIVAWYFVCTAWSCAATISLSVSTFRSPHDSYRNASSLVISCQCSLCTGHALLSFLFLSLRTVLCSCLCDLYAVPFCVTVLIWLVCSTTFAAVLIVKFRFGYFTAFNNIYKLAFFIFCNMPLSPPFLFTYRLCTSALGWCTSYIVTIFPSDFLFLLTSSYLYQNCILLLGQLMLQSLQFYSSISTLISVSFLVSWCIPSSVFFKFTDDVCVHFPQSQGTFMFLPVQALVFLCWCLIKFCDLTTFSFLNTIFAHLSSLNSIRMSSLTVVTPSVFGVLLLFSLNNNNNNKLSSCHRPFLPSTSPFEPAMISTA